jgi:hypothetical protein
MTKPKLGRPRSPNGEKTVMPRVNVGFNLAAAEKLKQLQTQYTTKLGFELTASQLIEHLFYLHEQQGKTND